MSWSEYYIKKSKEHTGLDRSSRLQAIGKTYFGKPIDDQQLEILTTNIYRLLGDLRQPNVIIDLGCGTGIISEKLIETYKGLKLILVDPNLDNINKCKSLFKHIPDIKFCNFDHHHAIQLVTKDTVVFTYEVIQHLPAVEARNFISALFQKNVAKIVIGGVPDLARRNVFYNNRSTKPQMKNNTDDVIGQWYDPSFFENLANEQFKLKILNQQKLYTTHYRFDVVYERGPF